MSLRNTKSSALNIATRGSKPRVSRNIRQPCFTMTRPLLFQVRKSLVEYVDEELLAMNTSVFYQRIFILAKNVEPPRMSQAQLANLPQKNPIAVAVNKEAGEITAAGPDSTDATSGVKSDGSFHSDKPALDGIGTDLNVEYEDEEEEEEELVEEVKPASIAGPKDMFVLFSEKLQHLAKHCGKLAFTPDPMCGLLVYMNDYTMLMLESGEDMMGIFCGELLKCVAGFWQSNRVVMIEDHIDQVSIRKEKGNNFISSVCKLLLFLTLFSVEQREEGEPYQQSVYFSLPPSYNRRKKYSVSSLYTPSFISLSLFTRAKAKISTLSVTSIILLLPLFALE